MPHPRTMNPEHLVGLPVLDVEGATVGTIESVCLDGDTGAPEWAAVTTGMVGGHATLVPLAVAFTAQDGVCVPYSTELERRLGHANDRYLRLYTNPPEDIAAGWAEDL